MLVIHLLLGGGWSVMVVLALCAAGHDRYQRHKLGRGEPRRSVDSSAGAN